MAYFFCITGIVIEDLFCYVSRAFFLYKPSPPCAKTYVPTKNWDSLLKGHIKYLDYNQSLSNQTSLAQHVNTKLTHPGSRNSDSTTRNVELALGRNFIHYDRNASVKGQHLAARGHYGLIYLLMYLSHVISF